MRHQTGFTLIELIMVIVILGLLSAVAIPKFVDLSDDAEIAAIEGVAGGISSAATINYAAKAMGKTAVVVDNCDDAGSILQGGLPSGYTVNTDATGMTNEGDASTACVLTQTASSRTASYTVIQVD